jgi:hypothetical protein
MFRTARVSTPGVATTKLVRIRTTVSIGSAVPSLRIVTGKVLLVWPGAKMSVLPAAM